MRTFIAEGPDGGGKTTLLNLLSARWGIPVYHSGGPVQSSSLFQKKVDRAEAHFTTHLIDRAPHVSELVYCNLDYRRPYLSERVLLKRLKEFNPIIVYCRTERPIEMFRAMQTAGKMDYKSPEHFEKLANQYLQIVEAYDDLMNKLEDEGFEVRDFDWQTETFPTGDIL